MFRCEPCFRDFDNNYNYKKHVNSGQCVLSLSNRTCAVCGFTFKKKGGLKKHIETRHPDVVDKRRFACGICDEMFADEETWSTHREEEHAGHHDFRLIKSAHLKSCQLLRSFLPASVRTVSSALVYLFKRVKLLLNALSVSLDYYKCNIVLVVEMYKLNEFGEVARVQSFPFRGIGFSVAPTVSFAQDLAMACSDIDRAVQEFHSMVRQIIALFSLFLISLCASSLFNVGFWMDGSSPSSDGV